MTHFFFFYKKYHWSIIKAAWSIIKAAYSRYCPETVPNFGHSMPALWETDAQHMGYRCPSRGLWVPTKWASTDQLMGWFPIDISCTSNDINMTFSDFSWHFFTLSTRKGRHYQFHKTEIADTCHYLDLSQQSNTINNKTKKKFPVFVYFLYLCHRIPSIKKTDSNKRR